MMKRHIAIPLLCVVLVAALSIPVFATSANPSFPFPENTLFGTGSISGYVDSYPDTLSYTSNLTFGDMLVMRFDPSSDGRSDYMVSSTLRFSLALSRVDNFYIAVSGDELVSLTYDFAQYEDSSLSYNVDFGDEWPLKSYSPNFSTQKWTVLSSTGSVNVKFIGFSDVPAGSYLVTQDLMTNVGHNIVFGVYGSSLTGTNAIFEDFKNGDVSYVGALDRLDEYYDQLSSDDIFQNILYATEYQNSVTLLNGLASSSAAEKSSDLDAEMSATVDQFADGTIDLKDAMDTLSSNFSTSLSGAQTVEEAAALTAVYQVKLLQLENENQVKLMEGLDTVITDEEIQKADDYYAAEDELVNAFDVANFDAQLQFDLWWLQMPRNETIEYKKFFDYLMNESDIKYFITIPLAMSLVAIIMGTRMRTRPDRVIERSTTVDSGGSRTTTVKYKND